MMRNNKPNRAPVVTDRNNPNPNVATVLPRELHDALARIAARNNLSKSAYLRKLIMAHIEAEGGLK